MQNERVFTISGGRSKFAVLEPLEEKSWPRSVMNGLDTRGLVVISNILTSDIKGLFDPRATQFVHPDADKDGVTVISPTGETRGGFSRQGLAPHSDRAMVGSPPSILVLVMEQQAVKGGDAFFVDSVEVVSLLLRRGVEASEDRKSVV